MLYQLKKNTWKSKKSNGENTTRVLFNEQLKAIQKELGEIDEGKDEIANISKAITKAKMPKIAQDKCFSELKNSNL